MTGNRQIPDPSGKRLVAALGLVGRLSTMPNQAFQVLHIDSAREYRGGQNQVRTLMAGLSDVPHLRQTLIARRQSKLSDEAANLGVDVRQVRWGSAVDPAALVGLVRTLQEEWDIVHAHDSHALQTALVARAVTGQSTPLVASRRVDFPARQPGIWRRADRIVAVSRHIRDVLIQQGIERSRIEVVYSGIDPVDLEPPRAGVLRAAAEAKPGQLLVAAVGALVPHKDHATFVRAASLIAGHRPDVHFAVFGEGPLRESLKSLVTELDLDGRFCFAGHVPGTVRSLIDIDIFVMPSREEGLGTACIEAMLAGLPIVATTAGGLGELAGDAFKPIETGDPEVLAREIEHFLGDRSAREAASLRSTQRGRAFSAAEMIEGTLRCYAQVAPQ